MESRLSRLVGDELHGQSQLMVREVQHGAEAEATEEELQVLHLLHLNIKTFEWSQSVISKLEGLPPLGGARAL